MNTKHNLSTDSIPKLFFIYLLPSITSLIITALYGIIDGIFVGRGIGKEALAAINIAYPIINFANALSLMFGVGGATLISIYAKSKKFRNICFSYIVFLNLISYLIIIAVVFLLEEKLIFFMGSSVDLFRLVKDYLYPISFGVIFLMLSTSMIIVVRNDGSPIYAFVSMTSGAVLNIVLDWLFIMKFNFGMKGAAIATLIGQFFTLFLLFIYFYKKRNEINLIFTRIYPLILSRIFSIGFSSFIVEFAVALITVLFNIVLMKYSGEIAVSAYCIIGYIFYIFRMFYSGVAQGIQPIISYNFGRGNKERVFTSFFLAHKISLLSSIFNLILVNIFAKQLIRFFNSDPQLLSITVVGLRIYSLTIFFIGINLINIGYLQAKSRAKSSVIISLLRSVVFVCLYIWILPPIFGINGIWLSFPLADATTTLITYIYRRSFIFLN